MRKETYVFQVFLFSFYPIPVLLHLEGNCHTYVDAAADDDMAIRLIIDGKLQRPGTCNATESLIIHRAKLDLLPQIAKKLIDANIEIRGDSELTWDRLRQIVPDQLAAHRRTVADVLS